MAEINSKDIAGNNTIIAAIDILPGFSVSGSIKPQYALAILKDGCFIELGDNFYLREIINMIRKYKPQIIASDNIFEIASNSSGIQNFLSKIPPGTKLVQVTGSPHHKMNPINKLAEKIGFRIKGKSSPLETAKIICLLAAKKIGFEVVAFENESVIAITRSRRLGPGGWSQARLRRRLHTYILNQSREIEDILKQNNFEYEALKRESDFGLDQSKFIVNAKKSQLKKIIKEIKGPDIKVAISPIKKDSILYKPLSDDAKIYGTGKKLIVGVDPGITTGLAIMNLDGEIIDLKSTKSFSRSKIINHIYQFGEPLVLASDTTPASNFIIKLAKNTKSKLYIPKKILAVSEKQETVSQYIGGKYPKVTDSHKRDALAAAIKAYQNYQPMFKKVEEKLKTITEYIPVNEIKADIILYEKSIMQAINDYLEKKKEPEKKAETPPQTEITELSEEQCLIRDLKKQINSINEYNSQLKQEIKKLRIQIDDVNYEFKKAFDRESIETRKDRSFQLKEEETNKLRAKINQLEDAIENLNNVVSKLKKIKTLEAQGIIIPVKIVKTFSKEGLKETEDNFGLLKNDILYFQDAAGGGKSTAGIIIEKGIKAVITKNEMSHLAMDILLLADIPIIPESSVDLKKYNEFYAVNRNKFESIYEQFKKKIQEEKESINASRMNELIQEYQRQRKEQIFKVSDK
jgi:predicted RNase H-like nuclease (RuvC/YqgF family)